MTLKSDTQFEEKRLVVWKLTELKNFGNFHQKSRKCQNWNFHKILLSKAENV